MNLTNRYKTRSTVDLAIMLLSALAFSGMVLYAVKAAQEYLRIGTIDADEILPLSFLFVAGFSSFACASWRRLRDETNRRSEAEHELRESEKKYRDLLENAPVGISVASFDGRVLDVNETMVRIHGYESKEEFIKSRVSDRFCDPKDRERFVAKVWDSGRIVDFQVQTKRRDGSPFWTSITAVPRTAESGEQQLVEVIQDITESRHAQDVLRQSEARYRDLADSISDVFFAMDRELKYTYWNKASEELTGIPAAEALGRHFFQIFPENEVTTRLRTVFMDAIAAGQQQHFITTYPGEQKLIHEISVYPSEYGLCVFVKDITERERAQAALKESETKFRTLAEQSPNMIFINKNGRVVYANQKCTEVMGYALTELYSPDFDFLTLVNAPSRDAVMANFRAHAEGREVGPYEYSLVTRSGAAIDCILTSKLVNYDGGPAILGTVTDITERKNAEARLAEVSSHQEAILSAVPDIIMEVDNDKVYKWANQAGIDFFGDGVIGKKAADYFAEEQNTYDTVEPVFEGSDGTVHVESWQLRKDGEKRLLAWWCRSLKDDQGKVIGALSAAQDITDRRAAEEALKTSELRLSEAQVAGRIGHWESDLATRKITWSDEMFELFERPLSLGPPSPDEEVAHYSPSDLARLEQLRRVVLRAGEPVQYDVEARLPSGRSICLNATMRPVKGKDGLIAGLFGTVQDITDRKQAEWALRESEQKYRDLMENLPIGIVVTSIDGRVLEVNKTLPQMHGYDSKAEFVNSSVADRFYDLKERERWVALVTDSGKTEGFEIKTRRKDGSLFWTSLTSIPRTAEAGEQQLITVSQDITERKNAEDALLFKNALLEAQAESSSEGILAADEQHRIVLFNRRFLEMWHVPQVLIETRDAEAVLRHCVTMVNDPERFLHRVTQLAARPEERGEDDIDLRDGRVVTRYSAPLVDTEGAYRGRIWYFRDITEPRRLRERVEHAAEEWRHTFDSITEAVSIQDKDFRLVRVNKAYARMFNREPQELLGKACYELMHGKDCPVEACPHLKTMQTGAPAGEEFYEPHLGVFLEMTTSPISDDEGHIYGTVHVARDVTKRREIEQQLTLTDRLASIGELAAGVAHEVNNPLTTVIGFSELLMEKELAEDTKRDVALVHSEAKRAAGIVRNLLTFARKHEPAMRPVSIEKVIREVLSLRAYDQKVNNIEVITQFAPGLPEIMADYFQLQQVFLNIVINAEYFMIESHGRGTLKVIADTAADIVRISVADDGPGISPQNISHVFDPFFTTKEVGKGTGLGLSICHGIVAEHGGRIYTQSETGKGATFVVELPIRGLVPKNPQVVTS